MTSQDIRDAFFEEMLALAQKDPRVVFLTADMGAFALERFRREMPERFINAGVAEQNMVSVAAGLALSGKKVFVHSIIPFVTGRCYEQLKVDLCCMKLPVVVVGIGAGLTYAGDGPTHHGMNDIALMRALPDLTIYSPCDAISSRAVCRLAYEDKGPVYIRLEKGVWPALYREGADVPAQGIKELRSGKDVMIIATSAMTHQALAAAEVLEKKGVSTAVVDVFRLKPLDVNALQACFKGRRLAVTLEEHSLVGGLGSMVAEYMVDKGVSVPLKRIAIRDVHCVEPVSREALQKIYGLSVPDVVKTVLDHWHR